MKLLHINGHAPLASWTFHPGSRLRLFCGACGWAQTYDPARVAARLTHRRAGGPRTPVSAVADHVNTKCPGCERSRWRTVLVGPEE